MDVRHLDQHAPALPQIAAWYHAAWGREAGFSLDDELRQLQRAPDGHGLPRVLAAFDGPRPIAAVQLKYREMDAFPQYPYWLGGMYVADPYRGRGIAGRLLAHALADAAELGLGALHLQTEHLDGGLYARHGWQPVQEADSYGTRVLLMVRDVG
ncbi:MULTISPECIES: GNAT family N-acetyltransferase [Xanthomonas]|uniref:GNAT family N-acetyltransferase n=1 Tax=Xanthomonas TaxID=338 RepID=UPI001ADD44E8|nr:MULTISPECIES: GNAT family N-acetyltransferase [unclassified Xanthomonas]MBO9872207.1 GNAT family N-acetyltransferase [Xanthomonas sp. D-93]WNH45864.1 GNAT family N-acetyltransferase [Xanthomonas sp. A6251]